VQSVTKKVSYEFQNALPVSGQKSKDVSVHNNTIESMKENDRLLKFINKMMNFILKSFVFLLKRKTRNHTCPLFYFNDNIVYKSVVLW